MEPNELLARCRQHGATLTPEGNNRLRVESPKPLPDDLLAELRQHKGEVLALLAPPSTWNPQEIARVVQEEGCCIFWIDALGEPVAVVKDGTYRNLVPAGIVTYSSAELGRLFRERL